MLAHDANRARAESTLAGGNLESASHGPPERSPLHPRLAYSCAGARRLSLVRPLTSHHGLASLLPDTATSPPLPGTAID